MPKTFLERMKATEKSGKTIILYTILWALCVSILLLIFRFNGKVILWKYDGVYQHFVSFQYVCDYLKDLIRNHTGQGLFNFTLGQGMDIVTTLDSYDFTDPISMLCALIFPLTRIQRYTLMVVIKLYLSGFSFLYYCRIIGWKDRFAVTAGALAYTFSAAVMLMAVVHPNYINWAYFFPFLLGGVELYLRRQKRAPLVLFVFLNIITSYYTFYINLILVILYVVVHAVCKVVWDKESSVSVELKSILKLAGVFCIGVLLSACILFPTLYAYLNNARIGELTGYSASAWHYGFQYYFQMIIDFFTEFKTAKYTTNLGLNVILIVPLALLFMKRKKHTSLKWLLVLSLVMLCVPLAGRIMNGFGYASNRWAFAVPFYASLTLVVMFSDIREMTKTEKACVCLVVLAYIAVCLVPLRASMTELNYEALLVLILVVIALIVVLHYEFPLFKPVVLCLVLAGSCFQIYYSFSPNEGNYVSSFLDKSQLETAYANYSSSAASSLSNEFYRVEMEEVRTNVNGYNDINGTGFWWSLFPSYVLDYYTDLAVDGVTNNCAVRNLDGRTGLLALASVRYYTRPSEELGFVPYGYEEIEFMDERYQIFENQYALPLGYTYSGYMSTSEYDKMNGIEKEQALMQGAVLDEVLDDFKTIDASLNYNILDYKITKTKDVMIQNDGIEITSSEGEINFNLNIPQDYEDYEIYVYFSGIELTDDDIETMTIYSTRMNDEFNVEKSAIISNLNYQWPVIRDDVAFDLGVGHAGNNSIKITFSESGTVMCDDIQIIAVPMSNYVDYVEDLGEYVLEDVKVEPDKITGEISLPERRILQLSIPYSEGWTAYVDGEKTEILKSDIMYMAIPLSAGDHKIELRYETPYLKIGLIVSACTAAVWVLYEILRRKKIRKQKG